MPTTTLTIGNTSIRQGPEGRYCLNNLHKAAGGIDHQQPAKFLSNQSSQDLISEI